MTHDLLLIGHVTADLNAGKRVLGGTVSYAARIAHAFGLNVCVLTSATADDALLEPLAAVAQVCVIPSSETTTFENRYTGSTRVQTLHGRAQTLTAAHIPEDWRHISAVHLAPVADEIASDIFRVFGRSFVLLTPQGLMRQWDSAGRVRFKPWLDVTLLKDVDLTVFSRQDIDEDATLETAFAKVVTAVVTDGLRGGTAYSQGQAQPYGAYVANEVDPTGAGDVFATSLLIALHRFKLPFERALRMAAHVAAVTVQYTGVYTPTQDDLQRIFAQHGIYSLTLK